MMPADPADLTDRLRSYLRSVGQQHFEKNLAELIAPGNFEDRFAYFDRFVPPAAKNAILVSGSAAGTELVVARQHGFELAIGTEVKPFLAALATRRVAGIGRCWSVVYAGDQLPFREGAFSAVAAGHVIEHTPNPSEYLSEHLRVLRPGGFMFLEFPDRNHPIELHTQLVGFEWAPGPIRDRFYEYLTAAHWLNGDQRRMYHEVRTELQALSVSDIARMLARGNRAARVSHAYKPAPGFVRMVIARDPDGVPAEPARDASNGAGEAPPVSPAATSISEAIGRGVEFQAFVLWAAYAFFASGNTVSPMLEERLRVRLPMYRLHETPGYQEDTFIEALFQAMTARVPELTGPHREAVLEGVFRDRRMRSFIRHYVTQSGRRPAEPPGFFEQWCRAAEDAGE